ILRFDRDMNAQFSWPPISRRSFFAPFSIAAFLFLAPAISRAQSIGQVVCERPGSSVSLYSSMVTLEVLEDLPCGQQVEVIGRYDNYFGVRTLKGQIGYLPLDALS